MRKFLLLASLSLLFLNDLKAQESGIFKDDRDGNTYKWIKIGEQIWMAENLVFLPIVFSPRTESISKPIYYVYGFIGTNVSKARIEATYMDVLYNYPAALTACPNGWHLPSDNEWKILERTLGMSSNEVELKGNNRGFDEGSKLKSTSGWISDGGGTNSSGFNGEAQGYKGTYVNYEYFHANNRLANWWASTEMDSGSAWFRELSAGGSGITREFTSKDVGLNVRCIKD